MQSLKGIFKTGYDPTVLRDYLEQAIEVELTENLIGRNLCYKIFRFPNDAWSYTFRQRSYTRATVIEEFAAPPVVKVKTRKFGMEYHEIGVAVGITDRMLRFADIPAMEMGTEAALRSMVLKQDRDVINGAIASVPFYVDGSVNAYVRLQNADLEHGEWKTFKITDTALNKCSKGRSHVIVADTNGSPATPTNKALGLVALHLGMELIEEHPRGIPKLLLINPRQKSDFRNLVDFSKSSGAPSIAPPQFNQIMTEGWAGNWEGIDILATHEMTPGTALLLDTSRFILLGEYSAPFIEQDIRDPWKAWTAATYRQYYQPAYPNTDYGVLFINLLGDTDPDGTTALAHATKATADAQYTKLPMAGGERAGVPG